MKNRDIVYELSNGRCAICNRKIHNKKSGNKANYMVVNRIIPKSLGGSTDIWNLQGTCKVCCIKKSDKVDDSIYEIVEYRKIHIQDLMNEILMKRVLDDVLINKKW